MNDISVSGSTLSFASKLFHFLERDNCFFSPFSIQSALGMCAAGAKAETAKCLTELLECPIDLTEQKAFFKALTQEGNIKKEGCSVSTANALWGQEKLEYQPEYIANIKENYGGVFNEVDFENKSATVARINDWCNENTREKIPKIINENFIDEDTLLILTNAIHFKGKWEKEFDKRSTRDQDFTDTEGKVSKVPMMHITDTYAHVEKTEKLHLQAIDIPYQGGDLSMLVVLPSLVSSAPIVLEEMYDEAVKSLRHEEVILALPRFKLETEYQLGDTFKEMGAGLAFSDYAQFDGITTQEKLKISDVIHKAFVQCDEEGTEAAAATAVGMTRCCSFRRMPVFEANRPFVFFIRNPKTDTVLFAGFFAKVK